MGFRITPGTMALVVAFPGILAFIFGVVAENKKPAFPGDIVQLPGYNLTTCDYPKDPTLEYGILSIVFLFISAMLAIGASIYPYNGKTVSLPHLWRSTSLVVFTILSMIIFFVAEALLLWAVILEFQHRTQGPVFFDLVGNCPTAKTGMLGGAGFLALDATLFFLITLMLTSNARSDYLDEDEVDTKGAYGEVTTNNYSSPGLHSPNGLRSPTAAPGLHSPE